MIISSRHQHPVPLIARILVAPLTMIAVSSLGLLLILPLIAMDDLVHARGDYPLLFGAAKVGLYALLSPIVAWSGFLPLVPVAALLSRMGLAGYCPMALVGAFIGIAVAPLILNGAEIRHIGGMAIFAAFGAVYALGYCALLDWVSRQIRKYNERVATAQMH